MLLMALLTSRRLAWAPAQVSQGPRDDPVVCVGTLRLLLAALRAALGRELGAALLPGARALAGGCGEARWAPGVGVLDWKWSGEPRFRCFLSGFAAWGVDCSVGISFLQVFSWWKSSLFPVLCYNQSMWLTSKMTLLPPRCCRVQGTQTFEKLPGSLPATAASAELWFHDRKLQR